VNAETRAAALRRKRVAVAKQRRAERPTIVPVPPLPRTSPVSSAQPAGDWGVAERSAGRATQGGAVGLGEAPTAPSWPPTALDAFTAITQQAMNEARIISQVLARLEATQ